MRPQNPYFKNKSFLPPIHQFPPNLPLKTELLTHFLKFHVFDRCKSPGNYKFSGFIGTKNIQKY